MVNLFILYFFRLYHYLASHLNKVLTILPDCDPDYFQSTGQNDIIVILLFECDFITIFIQISKGISVGQSFEDGSNSCEQLANLELVLGVNDVDLLT
jgi:hypothetical protein